MSKLRPMLEKIKKLEEERYNMKLRIENPTRISYNAKMLLSGQYSLVDIASEMIGATTLGNTEYDGSRIVVIGKSSLMKGILYNIMDTRDLYLAGEMVDAITAFHEIRHVLQNQKGELFTDYDIFCMELDDLLYNEELYWRNKEYHDSLYSEIDANLYAMKRIKEIYSKEIETEPALKESVERANASHVLHKLGYLFDIKLSKLVKHFRENGIPKEEYEKKLVYQVFFNQDGTFKSPKEIIDSGKCVMNNTLQIKILTSSIYLEELFKRETMTKEEAEFMEFEIDKAIEKNKEDIDEYISLQSIKGLPKGLKRETSMRIFKKQDNLFRYKAKLPFLVDTKKR